MIKEEKKEVSGRPVVKTFSLNKSREEKMDTKGNYSLRKDPSRASGSQGAPREGVKKSLLIREESKGDSSQGSQSPMNGSTYLHKVDDLDN